MRDLRHSGRSVDDAAADWFARIDAGLTAPEQADFERWLAAAPRHREVWAEFDATFAPLESARCADLTAEFAEELGRRRQRRRWRVRTTTAVGLAAAAAVVMGVFLPLRSELKEDAPAEIRAVVTKPEVRRLEDGSLVELNRGATLEVAFTAGRRDVRLTRGEAHFSVAKDPSRPFVVTAQGVEIRAVGTAFSVLAKTGAVDVVITEGRVAVARVDGSARSAPAPVLAEPVFADAGSHVSIPIAAEPQVRPLVPEQIERELAWRGPKLELSGTPLSEAIDALNRENRVQLKIADRNLAGMRVSGVFRADQAENFARILAQHYGVRLEREGDVLTLRLEP